MNAPRLLRLSIVGFWTLFWGLSVVDKVVPDVHPFWVGKDFFALFVKFFASLGLKDPLFATVALAGVSGLEALSFVLYVIAAVHVVRQAQDRANTWFFRAVLASMTLFALFSIADQTFGDRFQLLEHGLFWLVLLASWGMFRMLPEQAAGETPRFMATPARAGRWARERPSPCWRRGPFGRSATTRCIWLRPPSKLSRWWSTSGNLTFRSSRTKTLGNPQLRRFGPVIRNWTSPTSTQGLLS